MKLDKKIIDQVDCIKTALIKSPNYFLQQFAELVCGDNKAAVYKSSSFISKFFHELAFPYAHDGTTRKYWVKDVLFQMTPEELLRIYDGLRSPEIHTKIGLECPNSKEITQAFTQILKISIRENNIPDFTNDRNLNIKQEKLEDEQDKYFDTLLDDSEKLYSNGQKKEAINNLYDAFERVKNYYDNNKKTSISMLCDSISKSTGIETDIFHERFSSLTAFCNNYNIRHHDKKVRILETISYDYIYHEILNLLNLIIKVIKDHETTK